MKCCGLERDSQFCPKCGKLLLSGNIDPPRWVKANKWTDGVSITMFPDRHRIPLTRGIDMAEAELLYQELGALLGKNEACPS